MAFKHTIIFSVNSVGKTGGVVRSGGFGESYYNVNQYTEDDKIMMDLIQARMAISSEQLNCIGLRIVDTSIRNRSQVRKFSIGGKWGGDALGDFPSASALCVGVGTQGGNHKLELRGLPDIASTGGTATDIGDPLQKKLEPFFRKLRDGGWYQITRKLDAPSAAISRISTLGVVSTLDPFNPMLNQKIRILRTRNAVTKRTVKGGVFRVSVVTDANHFTIADWEGGDTKSGRVRIEDTVNNGYADLRVQEVNLRKVGAPIFSYRGRR